MPSAIGQSVGIGGGGGGGLLFRTPTDIFTGADLAACRTARNVYFVSAANAEALALFQADQFLTIVLDPANSTDNVFETYLPGNSDGDRQTSQEFALNAANTTARGMGVDATYAYVVDDVTEHVYVYQLSDGARQTGREFAIHSTNTWPVGIGIGTTYAYVADRTDTKVFVYRLSDGLRQAGGEFDLHTDNGNPRGMTVDATYAYVADDTDNKVYVYQLSDGARQAGREFGFHADNSNAHGMGVDATYAYVVDDTDDRVYVYRLSDGARIKDREFTLDPANTDARGMAVDATYAYVVDITDDRVYVYRLHGSYDSTRWIDRTGSIQGNTGPVGPAASINAAAVDPLIAAYSGGIAGLTIVDSQIPAAIMRDAELTASAVRGLLSLTATEASDLLTGASINGQVVTFTQADGSQETITIPSGSSTGVADGVVESGEFSADGTTLTLTLDTAGTVVISVPALLRSTATGGVTETRVQALINGTNLSDLSGLVTNAQIPASIMRDTEFTASTVSTLLGLTSLEVDNLLTGGSISGRQLTFTQNDGTPITIDLPDDANTQDGVISGGAFNTAGTELTLTLADSSTIVVSVPSALRTGTGSGVDTAGVNALIAAALTAAVTGNTETGIAVTYNAADGTFDFVIQAAPQTHTNFVGITDGELSAVVIADFTVSGDTAALTIPAYQGSRRLLFARPASEADPSAVYLYQSGNRNTVNQLSTFTKATSTLMLGGEAHNWWGNVGLQSGAGGYILEQVT